MESYEPAPRELQFAKPLSVSGPGRLIVFLARRHSKVTLEPELRVVCWNFLSCNSLMACIDILVLRCIPLRHTAVSKVPLLGALFGTKVRHLR